MRKGIYLVVNSLAVSTVNDVFYLCIQPTHLSHVCRDPRPGDGSKHAKN